MADDKIVTKKTAAKPAGADRKTPAKSAVPTKKTVAKKTAARAASAPAQTPPAATAMPQPSAQPPVRPAPTARKAAAKKTVARKTPAATAAATPRAPAAANPPLEEKPVELRHLASVTPEQRLSMVREAAYYKAERRGFAPGNDAADWAEAEREIDELLAKARQIYGA